MTGSIGTRLEEIRGTLKLPLRAMAQQLGVSVSTWQRLITDGNPPKGETLLKLREMGFSADWVLTGDGSMRGGGLAEPGQKAFSTGSGGIAKASDPELLARINDTINRAYRDEGAKISPADMGRAAADKYAAILSASDKPAERQIMVKLFDAELRQQLREMAEGGT